MYTPAQYANHLLGQSDYRDTIKYEASYVDGYLFMVWFFDDVTDSYYSSEIHKQTPEGWVKLESTVYHTGQDK